jgi:hypothetical protein
MREFQPLAAKPCQGRPGRGRTEQPPAHDDGRRTPAISVAAWTHPSSDPQFVALAQQRQSVNAITTTR